MKVLPQLRHSYAEELSELVVPWPASAFPEPQAVVINDPLAQALGLDPLLLREDPSLILGAKGPLAQSPVAMAYAGHQFGVYVPRLGDGRATLLGELEIAPDAESAREAAAGSTVDLHLKGSGPTPFARGGDGFATLGPMLREYLVSEAMCALGIPTSRSLGVVATGALVQREVPLPGAVLARVAASHIRVGTFQLARGNEEVLRRLTDYAIARHYPHLDGDYLGFYRAVIAAQAKLVAHWMGVGFIHGVMNTDNTMISGETIDYGPCAFLDVYEPEAVFSSIDHQGRYAYRNQPAIAQWNLARLGEALLPLIDDAEAAQTALSAFAADYEEAWGKVFARKLGLPAGEETRALAQNFLDLLAGEHLDFTNSFRRLADDPGETLPSDSPAMRAWLDSWRERSPDPRVLAGANPIYIPRNSALQQALDAAVDGDLAPFERMLALVTDPYARRPDTEHFTQGGPDGFRTFCGT